MNLDTTEPKSPAPAPDKNKQTAHQAVYGELRQMILFGDLAPGQAVTIQGLVGHLNAGMTPVREALRRLIAEGALIHQGNRRVSVPRLTLDCVDELGFMRKSLEPELARRAAMRLSPDQIVRIQAADDDLNTAIVQGDIGGYLMQNHRFHRLINTSADAPIMAATVDRLWLRFGPSLRVVCGRFGTNNLPDKHRDLINAFENGDIEAAGHAMFEDVEQGIRQIEAALRES